MNKNIINELNDYMFTVDNLTEFTKHIIQISVVPKASVKNIVSEVDKSTLPKHLYSDKIKLEKKRTIETIYKPKQKDSLFWCFYILKHGYFNYEMEINGQYFTVEKTEKFKYIEMLRKNKDVLKIHKIKPFTELEDDLANKEKISVKTFFALCILENINILLVDKRKIFELTCIDIDEQHPVNIVHRNKQNYEHHIELNVTESILQNYRDNYHKINTFDDSIKSIGSYKLNELIELCKKLDININNKNSETKKKLCKKDIYELLVLHY